MSNEKNPLDDGRFEGEATDVEFAELRELWTNAEPRTGSGSALENEDALTQASVKRLQDAWNSISVPTPIPLAELQRRTASANAPSLNMRQLFALAAAALVLFVIALGLRSFAQPHRERSHELAQHTPSRSPSQGPNEITPDIQVEVTDDQRIVLRSGSVRLYLAMATPTAGARTSNTTDLEKTEQTR